MPIAPPEFPPESVGLVIEQLEPTLAEHIKKLVDDLQTLTLHTCNEIVAAGPPSRRGPSSRGAHVDKLVGDLQAFAAHICNEVVAAVLLSRRRPPSRRSTEARPAQPRSSTGRPRTTLADLFLGFIDVNPGQNIERVNRALGTTSHQLKPVIRRLVRAGLVKKAGVGRAVRYFYADADLATVPPASLTIGPLPAAAPTPTMRERGRSPHV